MEMDTPESNISDLSIGQIIICKAFKAERQR